MLLRKAISLDARDAGVAYNPLNFGNPDDEAIEHGRTQVARMLADRPQMAAFAQPSDRLCEWAAHQFAKRINGGKLYWSHLGTADRQYPADHVPPSAQCPGMIRVNPIETGTEDGVAFDRLWACAVFELHNIRGAKEFERLRDRAVDGSINEEEYVKSMFCLECRAGQQTRKFYVDVFLPHAQKHQLLTDPNEWECDEWGDPEALLANDYRDRHSYPWSYYGPWFRAVSPRTTTFEKLLNFLSR